MSEGALILVVWDLMNKSTFAKSVQLLLNRRQSCLLLDCHCKELFLYFVIVGFQSFSSVVIQQFQPLSTPFITVGRPF